MGGWNRSRHCEERSDEAIQLFASHLMVWTAPDGIDVPE